VEEQRARLLKLGPSMSLEPGGVNV